MGLYVLKFPYRKILVPLAKKMHWIHPDIISYAATIIGLGTALCYYYAQDYHVLLIGAVITILLRMTLNTIDGVMAIERGNLSLIGEIVNALPDRYSDVFLLLGIIFSPLCNVTLGVAGMVSMFLVSYTGMLGGALGVDWQHHGPLGKVERLILVMVFSIIQYLKMSGGNSQLTILSIGLTPLEWCMVLFIILGQITVLNRLCGMVKQIIAFEWIEKEQYLSVAGRTMVVYDSNTGNTEAIAGQIADSLRGELCFVDEAHNISDYELIVLCTPNIRANPTSKMENFIRQQAGTIKKYALCVTYGMPVWGPISMSKLKKHIYEMLGKEAIAVFSSKGYHAKYKTYKGHPNTADKQKAFLFGIKIAKRI